MSKSNMKIYPEAKQIAGAMDKARRLSQKLEDKTEACDLEWETATLIDGCKEKNKRLYDSSGKWLGNNEFNEYYLEQHQGYIEDDYFGYCYFKTNVPGQFVRVHFHC